MLNTIAIIMRYSGNQYYPKIYIAPGWSFAWQYWVGGMVGGLVGWITAKL